MAQSHFLILLFQQMSEINHLATATCPRFNKWLPFILPFHAWPPFGASKRQAVGSLPGRNVFKDQFLLPCREWRRPSSRINRLQVVMLEWQVFARQTALPPPPKAGLWRHMLIDLYAIACHRTACHYIGKHTDVSAIKPVLERKGQGLMCLGACPWIF